MTVIPGARPDVDVEAEAARLAVGARLVAAARVELCARTDDLSMRSVARRAGIDCREVLRYVETREQLILTVLFEIAHDAHAVMQPAVDAARGRGCRAEMLALARAFRRWAHASPADFWVLMGPHHRALIDQQVGAQAMRWFYGPAIEVYRRGRSVGEVDVTHLGHVPGGATTAITSAFLGDDGGLDHDLVVAFLTLSTGLHGYLMLEACGQIGTVFDHPDRAFEAHMRMLLDGAGIA